MFLFKQNSEDLILLSQEKENCNKEFDSLKKENENLQQNLNIIIAKKREKKNKYQRLYQESHSQC
jgi:hypothetical protein